MSDLIAELKSSEPSVVCAAIDALETVDPEALKTNIVDLLLNSNVWVRSRAARAMCRWDRSEAIRYLAEMLFSKNKTERDAALNHSLFFPFNQIEALLLKYLTVENEPDMIQKAGLVFMANPDIKTAFRLYEAQNATRGLRSDLINSILMGVLGSLYKAELEKDVPLILLKKIKLAYEEKRKKIYIKHFSALLSSEEAEIRLNAAIKLCDLLRTNICDVSFIIKEFLVSEKDENVANKVRQYLESFSINIDSKKIENPEQRKILYASVTKDNYSQIISPLLPDLKKMENSEQILILHFIEEYGSKEDAKYALSLLDSGEASIKQAVIEAVCKVDQDALQPYLPELIKSESDTVKISAINAYSLVDKTQALLVLERMMNSVKNQQRKNALFCLQNLDFASVGDILISSLKREKDKEIRDELLSVLYDNANEEIFYDLYFQYKNMKKEEQETFEPFLTNLSDKLALQKSGINSQYYWDEAESRWNEERNIIKQREAYRLERVQLLRDDNHDEKIALLKFTFVCHSIGFLITLIIWFGFMAPNAWIKNNNNDKVLVNKVENQELFPTEPISIKGVVEDVSNQHRQAMLTDESGKKYLLIFNEGDVLPEKGKDFSAQVFVEDYSDSVYTAEVLVIF
jgi:HEAT repeat protein